MKRLTIPNMRNNRDPGKIVKYTPYTKQDQQLDDDLDEIAVVSSAAPENVKYGSGALTANGPRVVPGIITSTGTERTRLVSEQRVIVSTPRQPTVSPVYSTKSSENLKMKSASRQSLLESMANKFHTGDLKRRSRDSMAFVNKAHINSDLEIPRKTREQRRKEIKREFEKWETSTSGSDRSVCSWTFVFDPSGRLCYYWSMIVSVAFLYNFWVMIYRFAFQEINKKTILAWLTLDYIADFLYVLDICFHFRTGYLEEGVLQTDYEKLRKHYMNSTMFYIDCLCLLPLDFLYLSIGFNSILRCLRLVKIYRFWAFLDRTERHTNYPNVFRTLSLIHYLLVIFHWNACLFHIISKNGGFGTRDWFNPRDENCNDVLCEYLHSFYWSTLAWTTIGDLPRPRIRGEYMFLVLELVFGLFLFAAVLGHVANIVTNVSAARKEFQAKLDAVKTYMRMRRVPDHLQNKVIKWFDYLWMTQKSSDEERSVGCLPDKLKAEIAIHVHLDTLKRVEIFQNTEAGFLCELVLRLRPVLFSPGDYICRKVAVGRSRSTPGLVESRGKVPIEEMQVAPRDPSASAAYLLTDDDHQKTTTIPLSQSGVRATTRASSSKSSSTETDIRPHKTLEPILPIIHTPQSPKPTPTRSFFTNVSKERKKGLGGVSSANLLSLRPSSPYFVHSPASNTLDVSPITDYSALSPASLDQVFFGGPTSHSSHLSVPSPMLRGSGSVSPISVNTSRENHQEALVAEIKRLRERLVTLETENASLNMKLSQQQWQVENRLAEIELQICGTGRGASSASNGSEDDSERNRESVI
ncbi:cGMP-gated cation channel alpha-1-like isoform X2 [Limulus polyphemus]|uniref:cGMP-gated cation channel alpha-1-like isoform X2 n=1 Tax=Limulus polyphemus TaxID=6850 RepID=A0ABM1S4H7_LIMPO|nr:cGMP-gated cation channel alpha-1-like isoform X2 [Limulus polyphemus]